MALRLTLMDLPILRAVLYVWPSVPPSPPIAERTHVQHPARRKFTTSEKRANELNIHSSIHLRWRRPIKVRNLHTAAAARANHGAAAVQHALD